MPMTQISITTALDHIEDVVRYRFGLVEPRHLTHDELNSYPGDLLAAQHIRWIVNEARGWALSGREEVREKIMRRLAFCQGWLWTLGLASINDMKVANRPPDE